MPQTHVDKVQRSVVEYIGSFPDDTSTHGNAKTASGEYVRTRPEVMQRIADSVTNAAPRTVYTDMVLESSTECPRDIRQVRNIKQQVVRKQQQDHTDQKQYRQNSADHIQQLISQLHHHDFVQHMVTIKGKPPAFVLYTPDQVSDMLKYCTSESRQPSVMGIDRTFNLGECFVTCVVYKNGQVLRKETQEPPLMLGPVYLHWDGSYEAYHAFFSHLQNKLDNLSLPGIEIAVSDLLVGSDEEKVLMKGVERCFPQATMFLCCRHLEENARRRLQDKVGASKEVRQDILAKLFGPDSLSSADDTFAFESLSHEVQRKCEDSAPDFVLYLQTKVIPAIRDKVVEPRKQHQRVPINWTNNQCEAMNHILKLETNWKPEKITDLVESIQRIVKLQYADIRRSIHGQGNFQLAPHIQHFQISHANWTAKSTEEKDNLYDALMKFRPRKRPLETTSTDGKLTIPATPHLAKKPCQEVRTHAAKTTTVKSQRKTKRK